MEEEKVENLVLAQAPSESCCVTERFWCRIITIGEVIGINAMRAIRDPKAVIIIILALRYF